MRIGVSPLATRALLAITGTKFPAAFNSAKKSRPGCASSSEPPLANPEAYTAWMAWFEAGGIARHADPALPAEHGAREPPPVEEDNRLLGAAPAFRRARRTGRRSARRRGRRRRTRHACRRPHVGQWTIEHAPIEGDERVASLLRVLVTLHRRRRRPQHDERAGLTGAHDGHVAAVERGVSSCL